MMIGRYVPHICVGSGLVFFSVALYVSFPAVFLAILAAGAVAVGLELVDERD